MTTISTNNIYDKFAVDLKRFILSKVKDDDAANDIMQDTFLKIHSGIDSLKDRTKMQSWVYQIARNTLMDHFRKSKLTSKLEDPNILPDTVKKEEIAFRLTPSIRGMINSLPPKYRTVLINTELRKLTQKETAEKLNLSISAVKSRVQRGREKLKEMMLECCHFEVNKFGKVLDYNPRCASCR